MAQEKGSSKFVDRRSPDNAERRQETQDIIDRRIDEMERRRDIVLSDKLIAIEKLFNVMISTRSDANAIAISRIQGDSRDCLKRCSAQVGIFYDAINELKLKMECRQMEITAINDSIEEMKEKEVEVVKKKVKDFEDWKRDFWVINIPIIVATTTAVLVAIWKFMEWFHKLHGPVDKILM